MTPKIDPNICSDLKTDVSENVEVYPNFSSEVTDDDSTCDSCCVNLIYKMEE